jgi:uncharacterized damage-inducible protein DinB
MKHTMTILIGGALLAVCAFGADKTTVSKLYDGELSMVESEVVSLAEAMPAEKYSFAPTNGEFKGVRTFALQVKHLATVIYMVAAAAREEKPPLDLGSGENGPDSVKTKEQIVQYLKDSFAYAHKIVGTLNERNMLDMVKSPFGDATDARASLVSVAVWHSFDHYGQMVVYARMNGVVPPASRR